jgi:peptide/nickel transport system substrate-binding protein
LSKTICCQIREEKDLLRGRRFLSGLALLTVLALVGVACGSSNSGGGGTGKAANTSAQVFGGAAKPGGTLKLASIGDVDYMDPGQAYTVTFFSIVGRATLRSLINYPGVAELDKQVIPAPDLATALGEHNADNTEWTYHLKPGLKYGKGLGGVDVPGVTGQPIKTADIKYAIERLYNPSVGAGYATYYDNIEGTDVCKKAQKYGCELSGIETPDDNTIVFHLSKPTGDWDMRMTMPATTPVPQSFASKYDKTKDSDYDTHVVSNGPYYVAKYTPGESVVMKRNTTWDASTDPLRKAYPDEITWKEGFDNNVCNAKIANGDYDFSVDCVPVGPQLQKMSQLGKRFFNGPEPCSSYIFLNTTVKPFDDPKVRQAVNLIIDKDNLRRLAGGPLVGQIATSILPPGMVGALSAKDYDPFASPGNRGDVKKAKALMKEAGLADGFHDELLFVGSSTDPVPKQMESVAADLKKIGIDTFKKKALVYPDYYTQYYEEPKTNTALGFAGWCEDFPSPDTFLTPLLYGPNILPHANSNYSELDDPELNSLIEKAQAAPPDSAEAAWAAANKKATELAAWVPYRWTFARVIVSPGVTNAYYDQYYENIDIANVGVQ